MSAKTVAELIVRVGGDITGLSSAFSKADGLLDSLGKSFEATAQKFTRVGTALTVAGAAIATGLGTAVATAANFEKNMSKVQALSGGTKDDFEALRDAAIDLGAKSVFSASEAAEGMQSLAAAGYKTSDILSAMPGLLDAAAASGSGFADTSDILVSALSGFGLEATQAGHVADVLAAAANASAISMSDIGYSLKYVAPVAKAAGMSLEEVSAALAILGNSGIKADMAGTAIRGALASLAAPGPAAAKMMQDLGIQISDSSGKMLSMADLLGQLQGKFAGLTQEQRIQASASLFGREAMSAMLTLIDAGPDKIRAMTAEFVGSDGAARQMASTMTNNLFGSIEQLKGAFESAAIIVGTALSPAIRMAADTLQFMVAGFNALPAPMQQSIAIGAALAAGFLLLTGGLSLLVGLVPTILSGLSALMGVMAAMTSTVGLVVTGFGALVAGLLYVVATNEHVQAELEDIWDSISSIYDSSLEFIVNIADSYLGEFSGLWSTTFQTLIQIPSEAWKSVTEIFRHSLNLVSDILYTVSQAMQGNWAAAIDGMKAAAFDLSQLGIEASTLEGVLNDVWTGIKTGALAIWDDIKDGIKTRLNGMIFLINQFTSRVSGMTLFSIPAVAAVIPGMAGMVGDWRMPQIPQIPGLAKGGTAVSGGMAMVGENGPELLDLPTGASVIPLGSSGGFGGGTTIYAPVYITVEGSVVHEDDIWRAARQGGINHRRSNVSGGLA